MLTAATLIYKCHILNVLSLSKGMLYIGFLFIANHGFV